MAILVGEDTRLLVTGLTGRRGSAVGRKNRDDGTDVVAGVSPGKGGQDVDGIPVFDTAAEAVAETGANAALIFVPAPAAADGVMEAVDAGVDLVVCISEGIPVHDMLRVGGLLARTPGSRLIGPNCPGILSPGKANVGILPTHSLRPGGVGIVSRSGTLTYQLAYEIAQAGLGVSTIVGVGGDPIIGTSFADVLALFEADDDTALIVMAGEIGGDDEERAGEFAQQNLSKPVVGYVAGYHAPAGRTMGHAGAIVSGSSGTASAKAETLERCGIRVGATPTEVAALASELAPSP